MRLASLQHQDVPVEYLEDKLKSVQNGEMFLPRSVSKKIPSKRILPKKRANVTPQEPLNKTANHPPDAKVKEEDVHRSQLTTDKDARQKSDLCKSDETDGDKTTTQLSNVNVKKAIESSPIEEVGSSNSTPLQIKKDGSNDPVESESQDVKDQQEVEERVPSISKISAEKELCEDSTSNAEPIVSYSKNQRWPQDGEPICVICGRYGEYICDKTEADVCSLECKARNLTRMKCERGDEVELAGLTREDEQIAEDQPDEIVQSYFYTECLEISRLTREQVQDVRAQFDIFVEGLDVPRPVLSFEQLFLPSILLQNLKNANYLTPTPVQMQVIPAALKGRDLMVCAQTSSGKTASFVIPSILHVIKSQASLDPTIGPVILIVTPTRELADQIEDQSKSFMQGIPNMRTALLIGGMPMPPQLHRLKQKIQVIIATPGRLLQVLNQSGLSLSSIKLLVIDEVDSLLQDGFQEQVNIIQSQLPETHQTMLFSATIPSSIEKIAQEMLSDPIFVSVGTPSTPCSSVKQIILWVEEPSKKKMLFNLLEDPKHYCPPVLIFVDSKIGADLLAEAIEKVFGLDVAALHSDKRQAERTSVLHSFREGLLPVLVSTAVLGRGLDLPKVKLVINFDMSASVEEYIHQIGRTGRLGTKGTAISFINNGSKKLFLELQKTLKPLGVTLPSELINSPFLHLQREEHQNRGRKSHAKRSDSKNWKDIKRRKHKR
ncbi:probable ATP-dependent RNA helicase DDX59 isoform X2 [Apostichopus japonicus]|uniref:probable ATP-dependent RNA helicase DDX59 isoform X2 n=1 Tax=Stichopus japonicus TaxID=307972 RepID=UPI003AB5C332